MKLLSNRDEILQDLCIHYANEQCHGHGHLIDIKIWEYQKVPINPIFQAFLYLPVADQREKEEDMGVLWQTEQL